MIKQIAEVALIPLAIAGVGVFATLEATKIQKESSERIAEAQGNQTLLQHLEGKDVDITENFLTLLNSPEICKHSGRVHMLIDMASYGHSIRIKNQFEKECPPNNKQVENEAQNAVDNAAREQAKKLISALSGAARHTARSELAKLYSQSPEVVGIELGNALLEYNGNYRISLGILVVLGSVSGGWIAEGTLASQVEALGALSLTEDSTFSSWLQKANGNKKT